MRLDYEKIQVYESAAVYDSGSAVRHRTRRSNGNGEYHRIHNCAGNDRGGGDYHRGTDFDKVGIWAYDRIGIGYEDDIPTGFTELVVNFVEEY